MKLAILQMADTPQIESSALMLRATGHESMVCGEVLRRELRHAGCDTVLAVEDMVRMGYDPLDPSIPEATLADVDRADLFCEIKVRNVPKIVARWPRLRGRVAWWRVNGAQPEICPKGGDEVHLPCPVITACLWYRLDPTDMRGSYNTVVGVAPLGRAPGCPHPLTSFPNAPKGFNWGGMAYSFWPPYPRSAEYDCIGRERSASGRAGDVSIRPGPPYCVAHSGRAWGYGQIVDRCVELGVRIYGNNSPHGQVSHRDVPRLAAISLALVHLKSVDCPGWALYEAMLAGCPVVTGRLLNSRMLAGELLVHGETCLEFGVPATEEYGRGDMQFDKCVADIQEALARLADPAENQRIGENGRRRLNELMWREDRDGDSFREFMGRHFP